MSLRQIRGDSVGTSKQNEAALLIDNLAVTLSFENSGIASNTYTAESSDALEKETIEVHGGGRSVVIHDFKEVVLNAAERGSTRKKSTSQDNGQKTMLKAWVDGLTTGAPCIGYECLMKTSLATVIR